MNWTGNVIARFDPGYHLVQGQDSYTDPRFDVRLRLMETSEYVDFDTLIRLKRNDNNTVVTGNPATLFGPSGLYAGSAFVTFKPTDWLKVYAGKFRAKFGETLFLIPGFFEWMAEDYDQVERVGYGVEAKLPPAPVIGTLKIAVDNFYADYSSFLSGTRALPFNYNAGPPYLRIPAGYGPAPDGRLDNYTLSLRSGELSQGLFWYISYTNEKTGYGFGGIERGMALTVAYNGNVIDDQIHISPYAEAAKLTNYDAVSGITYTGLTTGIGLTHDAWEADFVANAREIRGIYHANDTQFAVALVRDLSGEVLPGLMVGAGVEHLHVARFYSWDLYPFIGYQVDF